MNTRMKIGLLTIAFLLGFFLESLRASSVTLAWDPSPGPNIIGYNIYQGVSSGVFTNVVSVGNVTNATISGLVGGVTYFFVATAIDSSGLESEHSNEVSYSVPVQILSSVFPVGSGTVTGTSNYVVGSSVSITAAPNVGFAFLRWTEGTNVLSTNRIYTFTVTTNRTLVANFVPRPGVPMNLRITIQ